MPYEVSDVSCHWGVVRPLVRYVDDHQAVIDTRFTVTMPPDRDLPKRMTLPLHVSFDGADGFHDEGTVIVPLSLRRGELTGAFRFEVAEPERWWPAGMGDQPLYHMTLRLDEHGIPGELYEIDLGMTSVRREPVLGSQFGQQLLVNGQICAVNEVIVIDKADEATLLPANGETVMLVRDHYGADLLYDAADKAGILLVQAVPLDAEGRPEQGVLDNIHRLTCHPSLAGYYVGHMGELTEDLDSRLKTLDPTRSVFRHFPLNEAA